MTLLTRRRPVLCPASGWAVRLGATDGQGRMVCPTCEQQVPAPQHPDYPGHRVAVVGEHQA